jgi:hypothetical protein
MGAPNQRNVVPDPERGWAVTKPGSDRVSGYFGTQQDAIDRAREILGNNGGGELRIHRPDGRIRDNDTIPPGHDPFPPKG